MNDRMDAMEDMERVEKIVEKEPVKIFEREILRMVEKEKVDPGKALEKDPNAKAFHDKKKSESSGKTIVDKKFKNTYANQG